MAMSDEEIRAAQKRLGVKARDEQVSDHRETRHNAWLVNIGFDPVALEETVRPVPEGASFFDRRRVQRLLALLPLVRGSLVGNGGSRRQRRCRQGLRHLGRLDPETVDDAYVPCQRTAEGFSPVASPSEAIAILRERLA